MLVAMPFYLRSLRYMILGQVKICVIMIGHIPQVVTKNRKYTYFYSKQAGLKVRNQSSYQMKSKLQRLIFINVYMFFYNGTSNISFSLMIICFYFYHDTPSPAHAEQDVYFSHDNLWAI